MAQKVKNPPAMQETKEIRVRSLGQEDPSEEKMAWEIPRTEEPGGLEPTGLQRIRHDWATKHTRTGNYGKNYDPSTHSGRLQLPGLVSSLKRWRRKQGS